jgi:hypothetical protein
MGQQQLLLIILGVIIVGIAIAVGITMFSSSSVQSNKDAIINDLNNLAANAYQFRVRPITMGGGSGSYTGGSAYAIPTKLVSDDNGTYSASNAAQAVTFVGTSAQGYGTITAVCDSSGRLTTFTYTGQFQ